MKAIQKLKAMGYRITADGNQIRCKFIGRGNPDPAAVNPLLQELKRCKREALTYLRLEEETQKALRQLKERGFVRIWSEKLNKEIYFIPDMKTRPKLPIEAIAFTFSELREITARQVTPDELKQLCDKRDITIPPNSISGR